MTTMLGPTSIDHFKNLHDHYLKKNHIVHAYAEPQSLDPARSPEAMWFYVMNKKRKLVDMPYKERHSLVLRRKNRYVRRTKRDQS